MWAERQGNIWRTHCADGPAVVLDDHELYFWHGWQVSKKTVMEEPSAERILKEENQTEREVLIQRMGVESFVREAELQQVDSFRESSLLKVNTAEKRGRYQNGRWTDEPLALAFLKVICPSTQKAYFLRVDPDAQNAKQALESTLDGWPGRIWFSLDMSGRGGGYHFDKFRGSRDGRRVGRVARTDLVLS